MINETNVRRLIAALDAMEAGRGPDGFAWTFTTDWVEYDASRHDGYYPCRAFGCARGLAREIGMIPEATGEYLADALGVDGEIEHRIFGFPGTYGVVRFSDVTPGMVARKMEELLP